MRGIGHATGRRGGAGPTPRTSAAESAAGFASAVGGGIVGGMALRRIVYGDNLAVLGTLADSSVDLIYIDPPFNTGQRQRRQRLRTLRDATGDRLGFQGCRYRTISLGESSFDDAFADYHGFLRPRLMEAWRVLKPSGSLWLHLDYREVHYAKVILDQVFGRASFQNEIIWAYDYGGRPTQRWPAKHDNLLWYSKQPRGYTFNYDDIERVPYLAAKLVGPEKAQRGKTPTDVWWFSIVSPTGHEKTGYATQKPLALLERIVKVHSRPGDLVLDFFAGSGTAGEAAARLGRNFILVDNNLQAVAIMYRRLANYEPELLGCTVEQLAAVPLPVAWR